MLQSIDKDDSLGGSETEEGDMLRWESCCSSNKISDDEKTDQFDDKELIVRVGDLETADTNVEL